MEWLCSEYYLKMPVGNTEMTQDVHGGGCHSYYVMIRNVWN